MRRVLTVVGAAALVGVLYALLFMADDNCDTNKAQSLPDAARPKIETANGATVEQMNISNRVTEDNKPGAIKHLYIISPYSGQVILYSTVRGKVTSSGKRNEPSTVTQFGAAGATNYGVSFKSDDGTTYWTNEFRQEDGTYGGSAPYIFWWDTRGKYHQHFTLGAEIIHISDAPLPVKSVIINVEAGQ